MPEKNSIIYLYLAGLSLAFAVVSFLVIITKGRPSFIRKKLAIGALILSLTGAMTHCVSHHPPPRCYDNPQAMSGWLNNDSFQEFGAGMPDRNDSKRQEKRISSQQNAIKDAQQRIVNRIISLTLCDTSVSKAQLSYIEKSKEFLNTIVAANGQTVSCVYDENDACEVTYRVHEKGLRKKIDEIINCVDSK